MYKVLLTKNVWNGRSPETSSTLAVLSTEIELPFVPFVGLSLQLLQQRNWKLRTVMWDVTEQLFHCDTDDQFIDLLNIDDDFDNRLEHLVEAGWKLHGRFPNNN